jgi:hypothetical protein
MIKADCPWQAVAHTTKQTSNKWRLIIQEGQHVHHSPQEVPGAQRGWAKLSKAYLEFLTETAQDPTLAIPKRLRALLPQQYPDVQLGPNAIKKWLQNFQKENEGRASTCRLKKHWIGLKTRAADTTLPKMMRTTSRASFGASRSKWIGFKSNVSQTLMSQNGEGRESSAMYYTSQSSFH